MRPILLFQTLAAAATLASASKLTAQDTATRPATLAPLFEPVVTVSGDSVDRLRIAQLEGRAPAGGMFLRSTSSITDPRRTGLTPRPFSIVLPRVSLNMNSDLPFGQNDGAMWGGKGYNWRVLGGATATFGPVRIVAIPEVVYSTNYAISLDPLDLRFARPLPASRSRFSSPFNYVPYSADYPYRFGDSAFSKVYPGQSSASVLLGKFEGGVSTENEWWGPAIRNPILFSDNAAGFPHAFIRTGQPITTGIGVFEGRWIVGGLKESDYFDDDITNDVRSISALSVQWKPGPQSGLTLGVARSVFAPADGYSGVAGHAFDFILGTDHPNSVSPDDSTFTPGRDQIFSVFAHWMIPRYGLEAYVEWARAELPSSLRDFILFPNNSRGYSGGLQYAHTFKGGDSRFRFQSEFTNVEQAGSYRFRPVGSFYTSRAVVQGYTNEGQMLGAGTGPGSSGEWFAADYLNNNIEFGVNFGRTRPNTDAFFARFNPNRCFHDVMVYPGARAAFQNRFFRVSADYSKLTRYNSFFQRNRGCQTDETATGDRHWHYLTLTLSLLGW
ncbi:MAG TPA: capsule assembly Wzi family protein [Gemmatimonadaceae bacterium]